jgi:TRAP-type C4-dicarboxylate transport system permease small subunit
MQLAAPLYTLFLGTDASGMQKEEKSEMKRLPASTRIRLKLLYYLCRVTKAGFIITPCIQVHQNLSTHMYEQLLILSYYMNNKVGIFFRLCLIHSMEKIRMQS